MNIDFWKSSKFLLFIYVLLSVSFFNSISCYAFGRLDLSAYPHDARLMFIHNISNNTFQPDVNVELTDILRYEIGRRNNFILVKNKGEARLWLYGHITLYRKEGRMYDNQRNAIRHELIIVCRIRVLKNPGFSGGGTLLSREVNVSVEFSERQGYTESEFRARQRLLRILAARINEMMEQNFASWGTAGAKK